MGSYLWNMLSLSRWLVELRIMTFYWILRVVRSLPSHLLGTLKGWLPSQLILNNMPVIVLLESAFRNIQLHLASQWVQVRNDVRLQAVRFIQAVDGGIPTSNLSLISALVCFPCFIYFWYSFSCFRMNLLYCMLPLLPCNLMAAFSITILSLFEMRLS